MAKMKLPKGFREFDAADYLTTSEEIAAYLTAAAEGNDAGHFARALGTVARAQNMSALARKSGLTRVGLYKALSSDGNPSLDTAMRVLATLGIRINIVAEPPLPKAAKGSRAKSAA